MGRDKAMLTLGGRSLIERAVEQLREVGCRPVISGSRPDLAGYAPVLPDLRPGCGPLGGIEAALSVAPGAAVLFVPVDLPLLPTQFLSLLLERSERTGALATIPVLGGRPQPLCAVYRASLLPGIRAALDAGEYKVMRVLEALTSTRERDFFAVEAVLAARSDLFGHARRPMYRWFANINTPQDLLALSS
jgi:molybdopterin-guanine dinucleotide biosynthesis protein A